MDAQERYWRISGGYAAALMASEHASLEYVAVTECEFVAATDALHTFFREHAGQTFKVFRPECIEAAFCESDGILDGNE